MTLCRDNHHNWICTLPVGHDGVHVDRSLVDGFVYLTWLQDTEAAQDVEGEGLSVRAACPSTRPMVKPT